MQRKQIVGTWEFNPENNVFHMHQVITHSLLSATSQFDGNISLSLVGKFAYRFYADFHNIRIEKSPVS